MKLCGRGARRVSVRMVASRVLAMKESSLLLIREEKISSGIDRLFQAHFECAELRSFFRAWACTFPRRPIEERKKPIKNQSNERSTQCALLNCFVAFQQPATPTSHILSTRTLCKFLSWTLLFESLLILGSSDSSACMRKWMLSMASLQ
jgi:hypothetical protein